MLQAIVDQILQDQRGRYYFLFDCAEYGDALKMLKFSMEERVSKPFKLKVQLTTRKKSIRRDDELMLFFKRPARAMRV